MKGFLTFTLAAGVAVTTTSIAQAAGAPKAAATKAPVAVQAPMGIGSMGIVLDRASLTRELERLNQLLSQTDDLNLDSANDTSVRTKGGQVWVY